MKKHLSAAVIITLIFAVVSVAISAKVNKEKNETKPVQQNSFAINADSTYDEQQPEMRGMWVSYISLDMSGTEKNEQAFTEKFGKILETAKENSCNTLFVHVRPFCDALYDSKYFPSSHIIWGEQGATESFDALSIMCEMCEKEQIDIHAWINPYRIKTSASQFELSENNPFYTNPDICTEYEGSCYLNPAKREARELVIKGVQEIIEKYNVDGIHFDDYFYPTSDESFDKAEYNQYLKGCKSQTDAMPLNAWRINNVNMLVTEVYQAIKSYNKNLAFGISPQGNIENDILMGADVKSWCEVRGYIDYICPQLYYSLENPALKFEAGLENWLEFDFHTNLKFYVGLGVYKAGTDADNGTWLNQENILSKELEIIRSYGLDGFILYDYEAVKSEHTKEELNEFRKLL